MPWYSLAFQTHTAHGVRVFGEDNERQNDSEQRHTAYDYARGWVDVDGDKVNDHYFYPYNGIMAVGNVVIDGVGMAFDDNGALIDDTATGFFTVNGAKCVYIDGVLQIGGFEYDGVKYYANGLGKILSDLGTIGYEFDAPYASYNYSSIYVRHKMGNTYCIYLFCDADASRI